MARVSSAKSTARSGELPSKPGERGDLQWWFTVRDRECRLSPEWALRTLDEAAAFLRDRGMLTLSPDSWLPSLFHACHDEPYSAHARGFGGWPKTKWMWPGQLGARPDVLVTRLHRGRLLYIADSLGATLASLCRKSVEEAAGGALGSDATRLMSLLSNGPLLLEQIPAAGLTDKRLRRARAALERVGAIFAEEVRLEGRDGGHRHSARLTRADQRLTAVGPPLDWEEGLMELLVAAIRSAVIAPVRDVSHWFSWPVGKDLIGRAVRSGRILEPDGGWVAFPQSS